jgi:hypothetical protein
VTPAEFTSEMLRELRREFYRDATEKAFFREADFLRQAIFYPANYLHERGVKALPSKYRAIVQTVVRAIKAKGNREKIHCFGVYFLHCVQEHMKHHGDEYYAEAKSPRAVASLLDPALRRLQNSEALNATAALAEAHRALRSKSGRKRLAAPKQSELFNRAGAPNNGS